MRIEVSETTEKYILKHYPHLAKSDVVRLFVHGQCIEEPIHSEIESPYLRIKSTRFILRLSPAIADSYGVDENITLFPDSNGVICKWYP